VDELSGAVERSQWSRSTTIIEIRTDREQNAEMHRRLAQAILDAL
jgi:2-succinyl-5-enolpyruvyl-6-hydroxy-3-cyclohexene-1-carboxylate synthase